MQIMVWVFGTWVLAKSCFLQRTMTISLSLRDPPRISTLSVACLFSDSLGAWTSPGDDRSVYLSLSTAK